MISLKLATGRLVLRPLAMDDIDQLQVLANDADVARSLASLPYPYTREDALAFIEQARGAMRHAQAFNFAVTRQDDGVLVGVAGLTVHTAHYTAEMGYWIGSPYWGQGYATEAARALIHFAFERLELHRVYAAHFVDNPASERILQKVGMTWEGTLRAHYWRWGQFHDTHYYGILRNEYRRTIAADVDISGTAG